MRSAAQAIRASLLANATTTALRWTPRSIMAISLSEALKSFVDLQVTSRGYGTSSEYVRELIRKDQDLQKLRGLMLDGAASPSTAPVDAAWFDEMRDRARRPAAS